MNLSQRDVATILAVLQRLCGLALLIWGPNETAFWIGAALIGGGEVAHLSKIGLSQKKGGG